MYQEAELHGFLTSENTLTGTLTDESTLHGMLSSGVGAAGDYDNLINKPLINSYVLEGNKTAAQLGFADVAVTGDYDDLTDKPTIPTKTSDLTNDSGFITSSDIPTIPTKTSELTNDSGFITSADIPTKTSELTNDSGFITLTDVPTKTSELTNDSGFITSSDIPTKTSDLINDSGFITSGDIPHKTSELINDSGFITLSDVPTKTSDLLNDSGFVITSDLSTVATTGDYTDLINKPTIPTKTSELTNDSGFVTSAVTNNIIQAIQNAVACFSASGVIASFNTDIADKLYSCYVKVTAVQAGSGTPSPSNVRVISGWSACNLGVTGYNIWDEVWENGTINSTTGEDESNANYIRSKNFVPIQPSTNYYYKTSAALRLVYYGKGFEFVGIANANNGVVESPANAYYVRFYPNSSTYGSSYKNDISINYPSSNTSYNKFGTTHNIPFNTTVYGGVLDVLSGVLTVTWGIVDLGTLSYTQNIHQSLGTYYFANVESLGLKRQSAYSRAFNNICEEYAVVGRNADDFVDFTLTHDGIPTAVTQIQIKNSNCADATAMQNALNGVHFVYELATPTTIQLTPTEVKTILGQNNIFGDCGDIDLKYLETIGNLLT